MDTLELVAQRLCQMEERSRLRCDLDTVVSFNTTKPFLMDYQNRFFVYVWSSSPVVLTVEEYGTINIPAVSWTLLNLPEGVRISTLSGTQQLLVRCTDHLHESSPTPTTSGQVGLIAAYSKNATTTGSATDTSFTWGPSGTQVVQRVIISNETGADVRYEFDAAATANSLRLKDGNVIFVAQPTVAVHFYTAASQNINQAGGVMIRGYN